MRPSVSIVVCTRNRAGALKDCFAAIQCMEGEFELIVVDNGSEDDTRKVIEEFTGNGVFPVRYILEPTKGLATARNTGWRAAKGDLIAFTDDDCYPDVSFVRAIIEEFKDEPKLGYVGGRIMLHDPEHLPITIKESMVKEKISPLSYIPAGTIHGANLTIRRDALQASDGFDELLGAGTPFPSEDIEMVARLSSLGYPGVYSPRPVVRHNHGRKTITEKEALERDYDFGRGAYYATCAINKAPGKWVLRLWLSSMRRRPIRSSLREIAGALGYLRARYRARGESAGQQDS
ncbi:MAG: glycosyltransferase [Pseudomonadota bacterium]